MRGPPQRPNPKTFRTRATQGRASRLASPEARHLRLAIGGLSPEARHRSPATQAPRLSPRPQSTLLIHDKGGHASVAHRKTPSEISLSGTWRNGPSGSTRGAEKANPAQGNDMRPGVR
jgi:hypothetical protein